MKACKQLRVLAVSLLLFFLTANSVLLANAYDQRRVAWLYNQGTFRQTGVSTWTERTAANVQYQFREVNRNAQFVELFDASRSMTVRLYDRAMYWYMPGKQSWSYLYHGRWDSPTKQPLNQSRGGIQRRSVPATSFPHLGREYEVLAPATNNYNCIAWSIGITNQWVWPGSTIAAFDALNGRFGFRRIQGLDYRLQPGVQKIVLYAKRTANGNWEMTHAARQLADGSWSSKLGALPLIRHLQPDDVDGPTYGVPVAVYVR